MTRCLTLLASASVIVAESQSVTPAECLASCGVSSCLLQAETLALCLSAANHAGRRQLQFDGLQALSAIGDLYTNFVENFILAFEYASNVAFVVLIALGFAWLPKKLMLFVALVGVFGPIAMAWTAKTILGVSVGSAASIGPHIVEAFFDVVVLAVTVAATNPGLAVLILWLGAFATSQVLQWLLDKAGLDLNKDGKVGWRDLLIGMFQWMGNNKAGNCLTAFALDELMEDLKKKNRAVRQNEEILERVERLEGMLLAMGGPDLREEQKNDPDNMIEKTSEQVGAKAKAKRIAAAPAPPPAAAPAPPPPPSSAPTSKSAGAASYTLLDDSEA